MCANSFLHGPACGPSVLHLRGLQDGARLLVGLVDERLRHQLVLKLALAVGAHQQSEAGSGGQRLNGDARPRPTMAQRRTSGQIQLSSSSYGLSLTSSCTMRMLPAREDACRGWRQGEYPYEESS